MTEPRQMPNDWTFPMCLLEPLSVVYVQFFGFVFSNLKCLFPDRFADIASDVASLCWASSVSCAVSDLAHLSLLLIAGHAFEGVLLIAGHAFLPRGSRGEATTADECPAGFAGDGNQSRCAWPRCAICSTAVRFAHIVRSASLQRGTRHGDGTYEVSSTIISFVAIFVLVWICALSGCMGKVRGCLRQAQGKRKQTDTRAHHGSKLYRKLPKACRS